MRDELFPKAALAGFAHAGAHCRRRVSSRAFGTGKSGSAAVSEDNRTGRATPPLRRRQRDHAVAAHGKQERLQVRSHHRRSAARLQVLTLISVRADSSALFGAWNCPRFVQPQTSGGGLISSGGGSRSTPSVSPHEQSKCGCSALESVVSALRNR